MTPRKHSPHFVLTLLLSVLAALLGACESSGGHSSQVSINAAKPIAPPDSADPRGKSLPVEVLRLHGSNTIGEDLAPELAKAFLKRAGASDVYVKDDRAKNHRIWLQGIAGGKRLAIEVMSVGSSTAFGDLGSDGCDVGMASRPIHADEAARLASLGDFTSDASENVIGLDGIAVIVNKANRIDKLTIPQLAGIFTGKFANWSDVGGAPGPIHVFARDEKSGTAEMFSQLVLRGQSVSAPGTSFAMSPAITDGVSKDPMAIGFIGLPYVKDSKAVAVGDAGTQALFPTPFSIATEDYPLSRRLFLYLPEKGKSESARAFVEYALSEEGQVAVERAGFVSLLVKSEGAPVAGEPPQTYLKMTSGSSRLSIDFRFRTGSSALDARARRDLDRVARFVRNNGRGVALLGFADNRGDEALNIELARQRAKVIGDELAKRSVAPKDVEGMGSILPVATNETPDGRERNRRVEVWLR